jgi:hypothetical protein
LFKNSFGGPRCACPPYGFLQPVLVLDDLPERVPL